MKIIFMGTPEFSAPILQSLIDKYEVVLVITQPDAVVGRKKEIVFSPVKETALKNNIEVFQPVKIKEDIEYINSFNADLIVTAAYGQIIPVEVLHHPKYKSINVHASLLPKLRGGAPIHKSIIFGHEKTGVTVMYMEKKMDSGDILSQRELVIEDTDNTTVLFEKLSVIGNELLLETIPKLINGEITPIKQNDDEVTFAWNIKHEEQFINWNKTSREIFNLVRGLTLNPGALTSYNGNVIKIKEVEMKEDSSNANAGTIIDLNKKILIKTLDGAIEIKELQLSGKKMMDSKSFLNGSKLLELNTLFSNDIL
ncbi:MAG: methionyl-tRNA formyltransferase [bacterium]